MWPNCFVMLLTALSFYEIDKYTLNKFHLLLKPSPFETLPLEFQTIQTYTYTFKCEMLQVTNLTESGKVEEEWESQDPELNEQQSFFHSSKAVG